MAITISGTDGIVGAGFTLDASGASVTAGVGTFGSLDAPVSASGLTGALPAISAANLTQIPAANVVGVHTSVEVTGNVVIGTSGAGIDFSATGDGTGSEQNELFSDYEQGRWTPTAEDGNGTSRTLTVTSGKCIYTRIGREVTISATIVRNDSSGSGEIVMKSLPFSPDSNDTNLAVGTWWGDNGGPSSDTVGGVVYVNPNGKVYFTNPTGGNSGGGDAGSRYFQWGSWTNGRSMYIGFTYNT